MNVKNEEGKTPLITASMFGRDHAITLLVNAKANVNAKNNNVEPPLYHAIRNCKKWAIKKLIEAGAKIN